MCSLCGKPNYISCNCTVSQAPVNCDPCLDNKYCVEKMDADCVFYNLNQPNEPSYLECLGIPSNTSLTIILEAIDDRLCEFESQCCDCVGVISNLEYTFNSINKGSDFYTTLDPNYFTKSDHLLSLSITDTSTFSGDTLKFLKYTNFLAPGIHIASSVGTTFSLSFNVCARDILDKTGQFLIELETTKGCYESRVCTISCDRVEYSERGQYHYRTNPQQSPGDEPFYGDWYYFNDVMFETFGVSRGGCVRRVNLQTGETETLSGIKTTGTPFTTSNNWGDVQEYDYNSAVWLDKNEISCDQPVIYFTTFDFCVCRMVRERDDQCDERANWKTYVIAGSTSNNGFVNDYGDGAQFNNLYGLKRIGTYNDKPIFLISDPGNQVIRVMYFRIPGNPNEAAHWFVTSSDLPYGGASNLNVFCDTTTGLIKFIIVSYLDFMTGNSRIYHAVLNGGFSYDDPSDLPPAANWTVTEILDNAQGDVDGVSTLVGVPVAKAYEVNSISKIRYAGKEMFAFSQEVSGVTINSAERKLRAFYDNGLNSATSTDNFTFTTIVGDNGGAYGKLGDAVTATGGTSGIIWHPIYGYIETSKYGGIRSIGTTYGLTAGNINYTNIMGQLSGVSTETYDAGLSDFYDTQYELLIDC